MSKLQSQEADHLFRAILSLENVEECYHFFEDLCTINEFNDMVQRFEAATLLYRGENYVSVSEKTGMSTATISRVRRCLHYGNNGYVTALERLDGAEEKTENNDG